MYLIINTARQNEMLVALALNHKIWSKKLPVDFNEAEKLLPLIDELVKKSKSHLPDLKAIFVITGPGPFTSLRIGITVANTLAYTLNIPVVGFRLSDFNSIKTLLKTGEKKLRAGKKNDFVFPHYGLMPHITKAKKKW